MFEQLQFSESDKKSRVISKDDADESQSSEFSEVMSYNQEEKRQFEKVTFRILTDSIIKSFMIAFDNQGNSNLLMNQDLIQIALKCIENGPHIKAMAQVKIARLLSLIL